MRFGGLSTPEEGVQLNANVIAVANGKGGVGKTSVAANLAGLAAHSGWDVLLVDLDRQGNVGSDLGYLGSPNDDGGRALFDALVDRRPLDVPLRGVRPRLDVVPGGDHTGNAAAVVASLLADIEILRNLERALASVASSYDLIVLDCPPAGGVMVDLALAAARGLLIPVRHDAASLKGLELMARQYRKVRGHLNPDLQLLGVVLFGIGRSATAIRQEVRATLEASLGELAPVFDTVIRFSERAPYDMRLEGKLAHEYEAAAEAARTDRLAALHAGTPGELRSMPRYSQTAGGLAEDYMALADEVLSRFRELAGAATTEPELQEVAP